MPSLDALLLRDAQPDIAALAALPKTYAATMPTWAGQVTTLPGPMTGARASNLCDGRHVALGAYGAVAVRGTEAFGYLWRRFGPPWWGCDDVKDLVGYSLATPDPAVILTLHLSASTLPYAVGYLITKALQADWEAPMRDWEAQFQNWWMTCKLNEAERTAVQMATARGSGATPPPLVRGVQARYRDARMDDRMLDEAETAIGPYPQPRGRHPGICSALHAALIECLRPVFIRDTAINILGHVPDDQVDERDNTAPSVYAGYGIPHEAMDAQRKDV